MNTLDPVLLWGNIALLFMALGFNIFAIYFGVKLKWTAEPLGPAVMALFGFLALTLDYFFLASWIGDFPGRYLVRAVLLTAGAGAVFWHLGWLLYVQGRYRPGTFKSGGQDGQGQGQGSVGGAIPDDRGNQDRPGSDFLDGPGREHHRA